MASDVKSDKKKPFPQLRKMRADNPGTELAAELASILGLVDYGRAAPDEPCAYVPQTSPLCREEWALLPTCSCLRYECKK